MTFGGFKVGELYSRKSDLHKRFGGQEQSGISTPKKHPVVFLITGEMGTQHGYTDGWASSGAFHYFGVGPLGDMQWKAGNVAVRDHSSQGKDLLLFQQSKKGNPLRFVGQFFCSGWHYEQAPDRKKVPRRAIVFELLQDGSSEFSEGLAVPASLVSGSLAELRKKALAAVATPSGGTAKDRTKRYYERNETIRTYVLRRAEGHCERCATAAPFKTKDRLPYLEPHHIRRLSDGGPDDPRFMAALCPNCHRMIHYGIDGPKANAELTNVVAKKESALSRDGDA